MPTRIEYLEKINEPRRSERNVEVYGYDKQRRLGALPNETRAFEAAMTSVTKDMKSGWFDGFYKIR